MKTRRSLVTILVAVAFLATGCGVLPQMNLGEQSPSQPAAATPVAQAAQAPAQPVLAQPNSEALAAVQGTLENVYSQVNPSVVNIQVTTTVAPATDQSLPFDLPGIFREIPEQPSVQQALGSGFVWDTQGHIVTNNHVVDGADKVTVTFSDGFSTSAKVVGHDPDSDLAVIKIDKLPSVLTPVKLADSDQVKVGQLAIAIGNPFGLEGSMTVGIVSAKDRSLPSNSETNDGSTYTIPDIIQTDASINPGNSGGVLVNDQSDVMGVTAAIESPVRANSGVGFVIPANIVKSVVPALIDKGTIQHPWLGISGIELTPDLAKSMSLKEDQTGVLVVDVTAGSPADKAGLRGSDREVTIDGSDMRVGGDVITSIDGQPVKRFEDLAGYLFGSSTIGKAITLDVLRDGKTMTIDATPAARPAQAEQANGKADVTTAKAWLGIKGADVTPEIAAAMGLSDNQQGVLVVQVVQGGPADKAELKGSYKPARLNGQDVAIGGDIITAINGQAVTGMSDLQGAIAQMKSGDKATLDLLRDGKSMTVDVTLGERPAG